MRGRLSVLLLVTGLLVLVVVGAVVATRGAGGDVSGGSGAAGGSTNGAPVGESADPAPVLDAALADGKPAYILIHSLT